MVTPPVKLQVKPPSMTGHLRAFFCPSYKLSIQSTRFCPGKKKFCGGSRAVCSGAVRPYRSRKQKVKNVP